MSFLRRNSSGLFSEEVVCVCVCLCTAISLPTSTHTQADTHLPASATYCPPPPTLLNFLTTFLLSLHSFCIILPHTRYSLWWRCFCPVGKGKEKDGKGESWWNSLLKVVVIGWSFCCVMDILFTSVGCWNSLSFLLYLCLEQASACSMLTIIYIYLLPYTPSACSIIHGTLSPFFLLFGTSCLLSSLCLPACLFFLSSILFTGNHRQTLYIYMYMLCSSPWKLEGEGRQWNKRRKNREDPSHSTIPNLLPASPPCLLPRSCIPFSTTTTFPTLPATMHILFHLFSLSPAFTWSKCLPVTGSFHCTLSLLTLMSLCDGLKDFWVWKHYPMRGWLMSIIYACCWCVLTRWPSDRTLEESSDAGNIVILLSCNSLEKEKTGKAERTCSCSEKALYVCHACLSLHSLHTLSVCLRGKNDGAWPSILFISALS